MNASASTTAPLTKTESACGICFSFHFAGIVLCGIYVHSYRYTVSISTRSMGSSAKKNPVIHAVERAIQSLPDVYDHWWWQSNILHQFLLEQGIRPSLTEGKVRSALSNLSRHGFLTENSYRTHKYYMATSAAWEDSISPRDQQGKVPKLPPTRTMPLPQSALESLNAALEEMEGTSKLCTAHDIVTMVRVRSIPSHIVSPN